MPLFLTLALAAASTAHAEDKASDLTTSVTNVPVPVAPAPAPAPAPIPAAEEEAEAPVYKPAPPPPVISPRFNMEDEDRFHRFLHNLCFGDPAEKDDAISLADKKAGHKTFRPGNGLGSLLLLLQNYQAEIKKTDPTGRAHTKATNILTALKSNFPNLRDLDRLTGLADSAPLAKKIENAIWQRSECRVRSVHPFMGPDQK